MKKIIALSLVAAASLGLAACSKSEPEVSTNEVVADVNATEAQAIDDINAAEANVADAANAVLDNVADVTVDNAANAATAN